MCVIFNFIQLVVPLFPVLGVPENLAKL